MNPANALVPAPGVAAKEEYVPARPAASCDLDLAGTEVGGATIADFAHADVPRLMARYPDAGPLADALAKRFAVDRARLIITAGADDALDRVCRAMLAPGRNAIMTDPTFEMIPRYVALAGAEARSVHWPDGALPVGDVIGCADGATTLVAIVSPNNPTGAVASAAELKRIHDAVPSAVIVVDLAYVEFADEDPTAELLALPRVVVVRTFSKAFGMPGIRVGYAIGNAQVIGWMRRAGGPYPVSALSLALAQQATASSGPAAAANVELIRRRRSELESRLATRGAPGLTGQANFVTVAGPRARWLHEALAGAGIATRLLTAGAVARTRVTIPVDATAWARLGQAIDTALAPEAILFDLDGVIADVSASYREAIRATAAAFGVSVSPADIAARKAAGNANDDWALTAEFIARAGKSAPQSAVTALFEELYQGTAVRPGLRERESLVVTAEWLAMLAARFPLGIVTGRPRADAEWFLDRFALRTLFRAVITREDSALKPDPAPVLLALRRLCVQRAWFIGDTPDDIVSGRAAGVIPIGVVAPGESDPDAAHSTLLRAGAARVLTSPLELEQCLN